MYDDDEENISTDKYLEFIFNLSIKDLLEYCKKKTNEQYSLNIQVFMQINSIMNKIVNSDDSIEKIYKFINNIISNQLEEFAILTISSNDVIFTCISQEIKIKSFLFSLKRFFSSIDKHQIIGERSKVKTLDNRIFEMYKSLYFLKIKDKLFSSVDEIIDKDINAMFSFETDFINDKITLIKILNIIEEIDYSVIEINKNNKKEIYLGKNSSKRTLNELLENLLIPKVRIKSFLLANEYSKDGLLDYLSKSKKFLDSLNLRKIEYLSNEIHDKVVSIIIKILLDEHLTTLYKVSLLFNKITDDVNILFKENNIEKLNKIYVLLSRYNVSLESIMKDLEKNILLSSQFYQDIDIKNKTFNLVPNLIELKKNTNKIIREAFDDNTLFHNLNNKLFNSFYQIIIDFSTYEILNVFYTLIKDSPQKTMNIEELIDETFRKIDVFDITKDQISFRIDVLIKLKILLKDINYENIIKIV